MQGKITLEEHFAMEGTFGGTSRFSVPGMAEDLERRLLDFEDIRLKEMDEFGIELAIQSFNAPGVQAILGASEAVELSRRANDYLAEKCTQRPDRFAGFAALPMQDPEAAIMELTRCIGELGFRGALVNGFTQKDTPDSVIYFDGPEYRPFWAAVEALGVPFYLHPRNPLPSRSHYFEGHPWFTHSAWAFAMETAMHALRLMASGLFDEHPNLQIILGHLGERIPFDLWRLDHRIKKSPQGIPATKSMRHYMQNNIHLTTSGNFHDPTLQLSITEMGLERIMFSVDYPFETTEDAAAWFDNCGLSDADKLTVGRTNAQRMFGLD